MDKELYQKIKSLREQGKTYQEIADEVGKTRRYVQEYCRRHKLKYSESERSNIHRVAWNKGQLAVDWDSKVKSVLDGRFTFIERLPAERGEAKLIIRCNQCGTDKTISSISLRGTVNHQRIKCMTCYLEGERKAREEKKEQEKIQREFDRLRKRQKSEHQMSFNFCRDCGQLIDFRSKYCVTHREEHQKESLRRLWRNNEYKRRSRIKGKIKDKDISLEKLAERDENVCWLCGQLVDWNDYEIRDGQKQCGNYYPSIDHIIAVALDGEHSWDNVKLAHRICNSYKGAKPLTILPCQN